MLNSTGSSQKAVKANYYVTEHFLLSECVCPCCDRIKIVPGFYRHLELLERMRLQIDAPITITSGYRCPEHNAEVGGAQLSWHLLFATDVKPSDEDPKKLLWMYRIALELGFGGIGKYETFIHLDMRPEQARWREEMKCEG